MTDAAMTTADERWVPIPGHEGSYEASTEARLRSLDRSSVRSNGKAYRLRGRVLKQVPDGLGYRVVALWRDGKPHHLRVHQIIAAAFIGPCPEGMEVLHGPAGHEDDRPGNLHYGTRQENMLDKRRDGTHHMAQDTHCLRGHLLEAPNLVGYFARLGQRNCLACSRGRKAVYNARDRHGILLDLAAECDRQYARLMTDPATRERPRNRKAGSGA